MITPNFWGGVFVSLATCLLAWIWIALLFAWDDPASTREDRARDVLRGLFDDRR
jgi:hypothetical protein